MMSSVGHINGLFASQARGEIPLQAGQFEATEKGQQQRDNMARSDCVTRAKLVGLSLPLPPETNVAALERLLLQRSKPRRRGGQPRRWPPVHNEWRR